MDSRPAHRFLAVTSFILSGAILLAVVARLFTGPQNLFDSTMQVFAAFIFAIYSVIYSVPDEAEPDDSLPPGTHSHVERERLYGRRGL